MGASVWISGMAVPAGIMVGVALAMLETDYGRPKWIERIADFMIKIATKF